jgi:hypothetical protein
MATLVNILLLNIVIIAFMGTVMADSTAVAKQHDADVVVPEADVDLSQAASDPPGPQAGAKCQKIWAKGLRKKYAKKCVESEYKQVPCPVLRALMGSGFLEWLPGTVTPRAGLMQVLDDVVGASPALVHMLNLTVAGAVDEYNNVKLLDLVVISGGHAASSGIIGAATSGSGEDDAVFNKKQYRKLMNRAVDGQYDATQWGKAVNMFGAQRFLTSKLKPEDTDLVDMQWSHNPFSWTFLGLEYANVFNVFKNANIKGSTGCQDCIAKSTVKALWKDCRLPNGFIPAKSDIRVDWSVAADTIKAMKVTMFPEVKQEMETVTEEDPTNWEPVKGLVELFCGTNYQECVWQWPSCGPCGIPGLGKLKKKFGYKEVLEATGAKKPKKEVTELPAEEH